jgi:hypothetical protein
MTEDFWYVSQKQAGDGVGFAAATAAMHDTSTATIRCFTRGALREEWLICLSPVAFVYQLYVGYTKDTSERWIADAARSIARRRYMQAATPLEPLLGLSKHLGGPNIWIKRDDLTALAGGGNKTRKLEEVNIYIHLAWLRLAVRKGDAELTTDYYRQDCLSV